MKILSDSLRRVRQTYPDVDIKTLKEPATEINHPFYYVKYKNKELQLIGTELF